MRNSCSMNAGTRIKTSGKVVRPKSNVSSSSERTDPDTSTHAYVFLSSPRSRSYRHHSSTLSPNRTQSYALLTTSELATSFTTFRARDRSIDSSERFSNCSLDTQLSYSRHKTTNQNAWSRCCRTCRRRTWPIRTRYVHTFSFCVSFELRCWSSWVGML